MALPAPLQALFDRLQAYNNGPYNAQSNPLGLSRGGNQNPVANFLASIRDFSAFGKGISDLTESAADNAAKTAEDAESTRLDRIATGEDRTATAGSAGAAKADADRAAASAAGVQLPSIAAAQSRQVLSVKTDGSGYETVKPNRLMPERHFQLSW